MAKYSEKLKDPRWQKKRLEILERDKWSCQICYDDTATLHVHHRYYLKNTEPWDYPSESLITLCESCHEIETNRAGYEAELLLTLRKYFFGCDLIAINNAFICLLEGNTYPSDVLSEAIKDNFKRYSGNKMVDENLTSVAQRD
jgi:hypothetical protein